MGDMTSFHHNGAFIDTIRNSGSRSNNNQFPFYNYGSGEVFEFEQGADECEAIYLSSDLDCNQYGEKKGCQNQWRSKPEQVALTCAESQQGSQSVSTGSTLSQERRDFYDEYRYLKLEKVTREEKASAR